MKQLAPDLFARRFGDLMEIGRARLPELAPDWTDHNAHDPGITLMELLAWVAEAQLYSLSPRPRRDERVAYAALLGLSAGGARPARGLIWPDHGDPRSPAATFAKSVAIPVDAVVRLLDAENPVFRPKARLLWAPGRIEELKSRPAGASAVVLTATNERGGVPFLPFGERAGSGDVLALTFECRDDHGLFGDERQAARGARWAIGVRAAPPLGQSPAAPTADAAPACHSPLSATLVVGERRVPVPIVADSTDGLLATGELLLDLDGVPGSPTKVTLELRAPNGLPRPPRLLRIEPNVLPIVQGRSVERELHVATGLPDWSFELDAPGLCFAAGEEPLRLEVAESSGLEIWRRRERLAESGPADAAYELDVDAGRVTFGNGVDGRVPAGGAQVLASYAVCDGAAGQVARNRKWHVAGFAGSFGVNVDPVAGGALPFGWTDQRREARRRSREEHALVSSQDLVDAAKALPLLEVARAWVAPPPASAPKTGTVTLVAMRARADGKEPPSAPETPRWLAAVRRRLVTRIPLGTRLVVRGPRYVDFFVRATLVAEAGRDPEAVKKDVRSELQARLALVEPAPGKPARRPGLAVTQRDLLTWIGAVPGVSRIVDLHVRLTGSNRDVPEVRVPRDGLPRLDDEQSAFDVGRGGEVSAQGRSAP